VICLNNTDVIEGGASVASVVDYTIHGLVGTAFTQLAAGTLSDTLTAALYTAGAAISVVNITLVNTHSAAVNVTLRLDPVDGGNPRYMIPETISLGIGYSLHTDGTKITVMDASGRILKGYSIHASLHENGGDDEVSAAGLSGLLADDQHVLDAEVQAISINTVKEDTTPELGGELDAGAHSIGFTQQSTTGDGTTTIDWKLGNKFKFTFGAQNETFTFTAPSNPGNLLLMLVQDGTGSRTITWPGTVKWVGGAAPTLTTDASGIDICSFYWDGTNYFGVASLAFAVPA